MPALGDGPTFQLDRFDWGAPDRLEVAGTFSGLEGASTGVAVLAVHGPDGILRLPAVEQGGEGDRWAAAFTWLQPPVAFDRARLELGEELRIDLPAPGKPPGDGPLQVHAEASPVAPDVEGVVHRLSLEAQQLERTLAAAADERSRAEEQLRAELGALRRRVAELEPAAAQLAEAQAERDAARRELEDARRDVDALRRALAEARSGAEELLDRIARLADHPPEGR